MFSRLCTIGLGILQISRVPCPKKINPRPFMLFEQIQSFQFLATFRNTLIFKNCRVEIPSQELILSPYQLTPYKLRTELGIGKVLMSLIKKQAYKGLGEASGSGTDLTYFIIFPTLSLTMKPNSFCVTLITAPLFVKLLCIPLEPRHFLKLHSISWTPR